MEKKTYSIKRVSEFIVYSLIIFGLSVMVINTLNISYTRALAFELQNLKKTSYEKHHVLSALQAELGYGGMIHNFKNYVLRSDFKYYLDAKHNITLAEELVRDYKKLGASTEEVHQLETIKDVIKNYSYALENAAKYKNQYQTISEIDQKIIVDDTFAIAALDRLYDVIKRKNDSIISNIVVDSEHTSYKIAVVMLIITFLLSVLAYIIFSALKNIIYSANQTKYIMQEIINGNMERELDKPNEFIFSETQLLYESMYEVFQKFKDIAKIAKNVSENKYQTKMEAYSDEDLLVNSINRMVDALATLSINGERDEQLRLWQIDLLNIARGHQDLKELTPSVLHFLSHNLKAQIALFYVLDNDEYFELQTSIGIEPKNARQRFKLGETLCGKVALEEDILYLQDIPDDYMNVSSGMGEARPREILIFSGKYENKVNCIIELASITPFDESSIRFIKLIQETIAIIINNSIDKQQMKYLLEKLKQQSDELQQRNSELASQAGILKSSEEKLEKKSRELSETNYQLKSKSVELEENNLSLIKNQALLEQKMKELDNVSQYKSMFLANMSHELRTPLNSLLILADLLRKNVDKRLSDDEVDSADTIYHSGQDLLALINDILDLSKIEAGKMDVHLEMTQISDFMDALLRQLEPLANQKKIDLTINISPDVPKEISTDTDKLKQILKNIIANAIKFTEDGDITVNIECSTQADDTLIITVKDQGIGISEQQMTKIFDVFAQADTTTKRKYGGTGLGLAISKKLIEMLGGTISVASKVGCGSTFAITLPYKQQVSELQLIAGDTQCDNTRSNSAAPSISSVEIKQILAGKNILLVDDDIRNTSSLTKLLKSYGASIYMADNGEIALQKLAKINHVDLVLMDIMMPVMNGYDAITKIREKEEFKDLPIIVVTAQIQDQDRERCMSVGATDYITKPVDTELLMNKISRLFEPE